MISFHFGINNNANNYHIINYLIEKKRKEECNNTTTTMKKEIHDDEDDQPTETNTVEQWQYKTMQCNATTMKEKEKKNGIEIISGDSTDVNRRQKT